jgi:hypothetical protein
MRRDLHIVVAGHDIKALLELAETPAQYGQWLSANLFIHHADEDDTYERNIGLTHQLGAQSTTDAYGTDAAFSTIVAPCVRVRVTLPGGSVVSV